VSTAPPCRQSHGAVGRADLLRMLAIAPVETLMLDGEGDNWLGYVGGSDPAPDFALSVPALSSEPVASPPPTWRPPLQMPSALTVIEQQQRPAIAVTDMADRAPLRPLGPRSAAPLVRRRRVDFQDLVPAARLLPAVCRQVAAVRGGDVDLPRLTAALAACRLPPRLPRRTVRRWPADLVVVLDFSARLWPFRKDMHRLARWLLRCCGRAELSLRVFNDGPGGGWSDWCACQRTEAWLQPPVVPWRMPPEGTPVLIVGDLGLSSLAGSSEAEAWGEFVATLRRARVRPVALAPIGARQLPPDLSRTLPVLRWSSDAPSRADVGRGTESVAPAGLDDLLAMVAAVRRVDPPLLRVLRQLNPVAPRNAGLEGALWSHPDIVASYAAALRSDRQEPYLERFRAFSPPLRRSVFRLCRWHHAHLPAILMHEEALLWRANCGPLADADPAERRRVARAERFFQRLAKTVGAPPGPDIASGDWPAVAAAVLRRAEPAMQRQYEAVLTQVAARLGDVRGEAAIPAWVDPARLAQARQPSPSVEVWLVQDIQAGVLRVQRDPAGPRQRPLGAPLAVDGGGLRITGPGPNRENRVRVEDLPLVLTPPALSVPDSASRIELTTATSRLVVGALPRPRSAAAWSCDLDGRMKIRTPPLAGYSAEWDGAALASLYRSGAPSDQAVWSNPESLPSRFRASKVKVRFGLDHPFGIFAEVELATPSGPVVQRLRWIEPGRFRMGSPADEPDRDEDEGPQHWVSLIRGFWLADTACPQAFWQAVTGKNPSVYEGPDRPVENVNWNDVQDFLRRLESLVPGCGADLPTEAEWEYACRAGTETAFNCGPTLNPDQAHFDVLETVPVRSFPPNRWGLYEMHGNVGEWCADGKRRYGDEPVTDPRGPLESNGPRVFRGGSWFRSARGARSAYRGASPPGYADDYRGFRLCLRSIEPSQGRPGGPVGAPGGRPSGPPRDEADQKK